MKLSESVAEYLSAGKNLTLLAHEQKIPIIKDWTNHICSEEEIEEHDGNFGWQIGQGDLVVDVDPKNGGHVSFKNLQQDLGIKIEETVKTPSGGFHCYLKFDVEEYEGFKFRKTIEEKYPGIDFLTKGMQCLIPGCYLKKTKKQSQGYYTWFDEILDGFYQAEAPENLLELITYKINKASTGEADSEDDDDVGGMIGNSISWKRDQIEEMLSKLDPSMGNDDWVKVGMALKEWNAEQGLELFEEWSKTGENYDEGETAKRWESFTPNGSVSIGTIYYMAKSSDIDEEYDLVFKTRDLILKSDIKEIELNIAPRLKKIEFKSFNLDILATAIQYRFKRLSGVKMKLSDARSMIKKSNIVKGEFFTDGEKPKWCEEWVYVTSHSGFMNTKTFKLNKSEAFNVKNGKYIPMTEGGAKLSASKYVSDRGFIDDVDTIAYLPFLDEDVVEISGERYLNTFNKKSVPVPANEYSKMGKLTIDMIEKHIHFICNEKQYGDVLLQWLAHQIQYPGKKILWSPVIQSIEGMGKSFFSLMLRLCLGHANVGTVGPSQITSDFNSWAVGNCVCVLEEIKIKGHNRYDAVNSLKPLITDDVIQINEKGIKQYNTFNTINYICFTNFKDAIPLTENDRRWWIIFNNVRSLKEVEDYMGVPHTQYYPRLFDLLRQYSGEVHKWLKEYPISDAFMNYKQAPATPYKNMMIATEETGIEGFVELKEFIQKGGKNYNSEVLCSADLFDSFMMEYPELNFQTNKRSIVLKKLGYMKLEKPMKIEGKTKTIWTRSHLERKEIEQYLRYGLEYLDL